MGLPDPDGQQVLFNQPDIKVVDKDQKTVTVIDIMVPNESNIRKEEYGTRKDEEKKAKVVPVTVETLGAQIPKLGKWLHHNPEATRELAVKC